jgi:uroporphyrinogen-III synthase
MKIKSRFHAYGISYLSIVDSTAEYSRKSLCRQNFVSMFLVAGIAMSNQKLFGKRIVITGTRRIEEMSHLIEKLGGIPVVRSTQGTILFPDQELEDKIRWLVQQSFDWYIFTTGIGFEKLLQTADRCKLKEAWLQRLQESKIACRGYKTAKLLKDHGISIHARDDDGTTAGLIRALSNYPLQGSRVALQLYGEKIPSLLNMLTSQEADVEEILPYQFIPPKSEILDTLITEILDKQVDALTFTSSLQVRYFFSYIQQKNLTASILEALSSQTVAAAVGKVTAEALNEAGVKRVIVPERERMGSLIITLGDYFSAQNQP